MRSIRVSVALLVCLGLGMSVSCGKDTGTGAGDGAVDGGGLDSGDGDGGCVDGCSNEGAVRCTGPVVQTCGAGGDGCLDWQDVTDCGAVGQTCEALGDIAECSGLDCPEPSGRGLELDGVDDHVAMGGAPGLGLVTFTLEAWLRWSGSGETAGSGAGGVTGIPIITKGRGESDGSDVDCNYFFAIHSQTHTLTADFEDMATGANHPVVGQTPLAPDTWYHVAASYDGATWRLYVNGALDGQLAVNAIPRSDSIQHFGLGTALDSAGTPVGALDGTLDEVRIWDRALDPQEILAGLSAEVTTGSGLVARWGLDETAGTTASDDVSGFTGQVSGGTWVEPGAPFALVLPLDEPTLISPADGVLAGTDSAALSVWVGGVATDPVEVTFWGREVDPDFAIVVLPDTQYYAEDYPWIFLDQTQWIADHRQDLNIRAVLHAGDITDNGDAAPDEWMVADAAMSLLEVPQPGLPDGIPWGFTVGNHDQLPHGDPDGTTVQLDATFGVNRFAGRGYYGGHYGDDNHNHFILFDAGSAAFLAIFLEYDEDADPLVLDWAHGVIGAHPDHVVILTSHYLIRTGDPGPWGAQGAATYDALKDQPNLDLMICGHIGGEGRRTDTFAGHELTTLLADYQFRDDGGSGWLRIMIFSPGRQQLHIRTYSTVLDQWETDADSDFLLSYQTSLPPMAQLGQATTVLPSTQVSYPWTGLSGGATYQWSATARRCGAERTTPTWTFSTAP